MKRFGFGLVLLVALALPTTAAYAQGFLPNCDQTWYKIKDGPTVLAQNYTDDLGPIESVQTTNACGLEDFVKVFINLADWGLTIIAVLTLFFFAWGAWDWVIAAGRQEMISNGKKKMAGAITGLGLVLFAWLIVGLVVGSITGNVEGYVFPGSSSQRLWFGDKASCKNTYTIHDCTAGANTTIQNGCSDSPSTEFGQIAQIQKRLADHQCDVGSADGCYGPKTQAAVLDFQQSNDLNPTGQVDLETYNKLMAGGFPCGFDPNNIPLKGCCVPVEANPNPSQKCIENILQTKCEGTAHATLSGAVKIRYRFTAGNCPDDPCSGNICTYDDSPSSYCK